MYDPEERFVTFASSCLYLVRIGHPFRAGVNWSIAVRFAGDLADKSKRDGGEQFQRAWVLLRALEGAHDQLAQAE